MLSNSNIIFNVFFVLGRWSFKGPSPECCDGLMAIQSDIGWSLGECEAACKCLKYAATLFPGLQKSKYETLQELCHEDINLPPISKDADCTKCCDQPPTCEFVFVFVFVWIQYTCLMINGVSWSILKILKKSEELYEYG